MIYFPVPAATSPGFYVFLMGALQSNAGRFGIVGTWMRRSALALLLLLPVLVVFSQPAQAKSRMWVAVDNAKRHSCPSMECGIMGRLFFRETVVVYETGKGWSRVSDYTNAGCFEGKSAFVQSGRDDCSKENGISQGEFAIWVRSDFLTDQKPAMLPDP